MSKTFRCPNCGSGSREIISDTEYKCVHCSTVFHDDSKQKIEQAVAEHVKKAVGRQQHNPMQASFDHSRRMGRTILVVVLLITGIAVGAGVYLSKQAMDAQEQQRKEINDQIQQSLKDGGVK